MTDREKLILRARHLLRGVTPTADDCGCRCGKRCCSGDEETGMYVFPGEERFLRGEKDLVLHPGEPAVAVCRGVCSRAGRPLACMIFPYLPAVLPDGSCAVLPDLRAYTICPLLRDAAPPSPLFMRRLHTAARLLARDETLRAFLGMLYEENRDAARLLASFTEAKN